MIPLLQHFFLYVFRVFAIIQFSHVFCILRCAFELISTHKWARCNFFSFIHSSFFHRYHGDFCTIYVGNDTLKAYTISFALFFFASFIYISSTSSSFYFSFLVVFCYRSVSQVFTNVLFRLFQTFLCNAAKTAHATAHMVHFESEMCRRNAWQKKTTKHFMNSIKMNTKDIWNGKKTNYKLVTCHIWAWVNIKFQKTN